MAKGVCPLCGNTYFIAFKQDPFLTRCLTCKGNVTNLSLIPVINEHTHNDYSKSAYELSSYGSTYDFLKRHFTNTTASEYMPTEKLGDRINGIFNQDVQQLTFSTASFDIVTSNQVFEHVPDDVKGYAECLRVLRPGGALIFAVPLYDTPKTEAKATLKNGEVVFNGEPEYHDSRLAGAKSSPVFHRHSMHDICERVKSVGFSSVTLKMITLIHIQGKPQYVIYAVK